MRESYTGFGDKRSNFEEKPEEASSVVRNSLVSVRPAIIKEEDAEYKLKIKSSREQPLTVPPTIMANKGHFSALLNRQNFMEKKSDNQTKITLESD